MSRVYYRNQIEDIDQLVAKGHEQFNQMHTEYDTAIDQITQGFQHYFVEARAKNSKRACSIKRELAGRGVTV